MIFFDSIGLEDIAPVRIDDIYISPIQISPQARQRVGMGQDFVRMNGGSRTITITFALLTNDRDQRYSQIMDIVAWAKPYEQHSLQLPQKEGFHFDCICTGYPEPSYRQWWESKLRLVFTTFENPYWTRDESSLVACGQNMVIDGTAPPLMQIERTLASAASSSQSYTADGKTMTFSQLPAGNLVIDLNRQTARVGSTSVMQYFSKTGAFIIPRTGVFNVTGTGKVRFWERWV